MSSKKHARDVLGKEEFWLLPLQYTDEVKEELTSFIFDTTLRPSLTPALARGTTDYTITVGNFGYFDVCNATCIKDGLRVITSICSPDFGVVFISPNNVKARLFEAEIKPSSSSKKGNYLHSISSVQLLIGRTSIIQRLWFGLHRDERDEHLFEGNASVLEGITIVLHVVIVIVGVGEEVITIAEDIVVREIGLR